MDLPSALAFATDLARRAGEIILRHYALPIDTTQKSTRIDIVTATDREVEEFVVREITTRFPSHHIVGEEGGGQGAPRETAPYHWYVDPVDGTVNFASKVPHFCFSIALTTPDRDSLIGVVFDPVKNELFSAVKGRGAFLNDTPIQVSRTRELIDSVVASGFPYSKATNPDNNLREWSAFLVRIRGERRFGAAALDLAWVACGRLDGYWENGLRPYDGMAGILLVREAGGRVTDYAGGNSPQLRDHGHYVASNGQVHDEMLGVLRDCRQLD